MAEWSKAPDSRCMPYIAQLCREFWSTDVGVGSNPTSDKQLLPELQEMLKIVLSDFCDSILAYLISLVGNTNKEQFLI